MTDEASLGGVETRLRRFWTDALRKAGGSEKLAPGARRLAGRLQELGVLGNNGKPYVAKSIEAWPAARRFPAAEVMFVVAIDLGLSLDQYVHGRAVEQPDDLAHEVEKLKSTQAWLLTWMLRDPEAAAAYAEEIKTREAQRRDELGA